MTQIHQTSNEIAAIQAKNSVKVQVTDSICDEISERFSIVYGSSAVV
jgi:hypothetical protein